MKFRNEKTYGANLTNLNEKAADHRRLFRSLARPPPGHDVRARIASLMAPMARPGLRLLGQVDVQFMMV